MSSRRSGYRKEVTMSERLVRGILKAVDEKDGSVPQLIAHGLDTCAARITEDDMWTQRRWWAGKAVFKVTVSIDLKTVNLIDKVAEKWAVPKVQVIRAILGRYVALQ